MKCTHDHKVNIYAKTSDRCYVEFIEPNASAHAGGYPPAFIGSNDSVEFTFCTDCGLILYKDFPLDKDTIIADILNM